MSEEHHSESFWTKYVFSQDHKWIGIQYGVTALFFMLFGFMLMIVMRYQMVHAGTISPDTYNSFGAMHGTIMVFLGIVPVIVGAYGNYLVPLQIGAPDMAFPKLNMASYWCYFLGGVTMLAGFALPGGAANSGWTSYPPLSNIATTGQTVWLLGMLFLIASSLLGSINIIVTTIQLKPLIYLLIYILARELPRAIIRNELCVGLPLRTTYCLGCLG